MSVNLKEIKIGKGLGSLMFGSTRDHVKIMLGKPTDVEKYNLSELENDETEAWHYDELGLSLSFDEENEWLLSSIAISDEECTLDGIKLIGKSKKEVLDEFKKHNWGTPEEDEEISEDNPDSCLMHVDQLSMSLWFENDELSEIQIGSKDY